MKDFIRQAFALSVKTGYTNWGVYPANNPYFMKAKTSNLSDYVSTNLVYVIGFMTGVINNREAEVAQSMTKKITRDQLNII